MPAASSLPTTVTANVTPNHAPDSAIVNDAINNLYKASIGSTRAGAFTIAQSNSGEFIPVNVTSSVAIVVPVLEVGTSVELYQQGTAGFTLTASGVTFEYATGTTPVPRAQRASISLLWITTTRVYVSGDLG